MRLWVDFCAVLCYPTDMKDKESNTANQVWINPYTGREMGATLDDLIRELKEKQEKEKQK